MKRKLLTATATLLAGLAQLSNAQQLPPEFPGMPAPCTQTRTLLIGDVDMFAAGGPMATPWMSPAMTTMFSGKPRRTFDDSNGTSVPRDKWFGASIPLGSCKICKATLEIRIKRNPGPAEPATGQNGNDTIYVGTAPFSGANTLAAVKPWVGEAATVKTVTIPLTAAQLNSLVFGTGVLDVLIQDDTSVDYVKLTLTQ